MDLLLNERLYRAFTCPTDFDMLNYSQENTILTIPIPTFTLNINSQGLTIALVALAVGAFFLLFLLIVVIESAVLQLLNWDKFRPSLRSAFLMNLASILFSGVFLFLVPRLGLLGLLVAWVISVSIEGFVLNRLKPGPTIHNWMVAITANLVSYLLLLLPTFMFSLK
jgi:hypothetical protein